MKGYNNANNQYWGTYQKAAAEFGVSAEMLSRQGFAESSWKPDATGKLLKHRPVGDNQAHGIAQFLPSTAKQYGYSVDDLYVPEKAIQLQAKYMADLKKQLGGNEEHALAAYNWGIGNVKKHLKANGGKLNYDKLPAETQGYLKKIGGFSKETMQAVKDAPVDTSQAVPMPRVGTVTDSASDSAAMLTAGTPVGTPLGQRPDASFADHIAASFRRTNSLNAWLENQEAIDGFDRQVMSEEDMQWLKEEGVEGHDAEFIIQNWHGREAAKNQAELLNARHMDTQMAAQAGAVGSFLMDAATSFADPASIAAGLIPGGALLKGAKLVGYANRSRAALIASHAAVGASTNIAVDHVLSKQLGMESDPMVNGAVGAALGALGGAWVKHTGNPVNAARVAPLNEAMEKAHLDATATQLELQGIEAERPKVDDDKSVFGSTASQLGQEVIEKSYGVRFDAIGRLLKAPSEKLRRVAALMSPDPTTRNTVGRTLEEHGGDIDAIRRNAIVGVAQAADKHTPGISKNPEAMMAINDEAVRAVIDTTGQVYKNASPVVRDVADQMRKFWKENAEAINGSKLLKNALNDPNYFYMPVNEAKMRTAIKRFGSLENLKRQLKQWAAKAVDDEYIQAKYDEALKKHEEKFKDNPDANGFVSPNEFREMWAEGWANTKMDTGILNMDKAAKENFTTNPDFLEHAARMNRGLEIQGIDGQSFKLTDLTTTNFWEASGAYSGTLKGHYGIKMAYGTDMQGVLQQITDACNEMRAKGDTGAANKFEKQAKQALSTAMGISPYASDSVFYRTLGALRGAEHFKLAGGFGLNAAGEALGAIATMGLKSAFRIFGGLEATIKGAQRGDAQAIDSLKFMERVFGYDEMRLNLIDHSGYGGDFYQGHTDLGFAGTIDKAAYGIKRGAQWANRITGFETFQRRTMEGLRLHLYEELKGAIKGNAGNGFMAHLTDDRIKQYGLTRPEFDSMVKDAKKFIKKNGEIDVKKWQAKNPETFLDMKTLLGRMANESIQKHSMNDLPTFMQHPVAQTLFQFMTFPVAAFSRNTLKAVRDRDSVAAFKVLGTSIGASLVYASRMAVNSLEQDDPQAYRDDKLSLEKIALVGFARSSFASIIPSVTNSVLPFDIPGLADARTTGNSMSILGGAVTNDADRMVKLARSGMAWMHDDEYSFSDSDRKAARQLVLPNWIGLGLLYSKVGEALGD